MSFIPDFNVAIFPWDGFVPPGRDARIEFPESPLVSQRAFKTDFIKPMPPMNLGLFSAPRHVDQDVPRRTLFEIISENVLGTHTYRYEDEGSASGATYALVGSGLEFWQEINQARLNGFRGGIK